MFSVKHVYTYKLVKFCLPNVIKYLTGSTWIMSQNIDFSFQKKKLIFFDLFINWYHENKNKIELYILNIWKASKVALLKTSITISF